MSLWVDSSHFVAHGFHFYAEISRSANVDRQEWNRHAEEFEEAICDVIADETNDQVRRFVAAARLPSDPVLVDLGCGLGSFVGKFGARFRKVVAVDFAGQIIARAKRRCRKQRSITWLVADIASVFKKIDMRADLTVCMNVITSPSAAKRNALWSCLARITKPHGYALIVVPSVESNRMVEKRYDDIGKADELKSKRNGLVQREDSWQKHFERGELVSVLAQYGFDVRRLGRVSYAWSSEGLRSRRTDKALPWDWICLAQRV
jgi:SAM-dependent methyltransferase